MTFIQNSAAYCLRQLTIFGKTQAAAYREHAGVVKTILGEDIETHLIARLVDWAKNGENRTIVLTGNAGTGKTAAAENFCSAFGAGLPNEDELTQVSPGAYVIKDFSGVSESSRASQLTEAVVRGSDGKVLVCANEGVLRLALSQIGDLKLTRILDKALQNGAWENDGVLILNVNRQRPTADGLWQRIVGYLCREDLWKECGECPAKKDRCCPIYFNAEKIRSPECLESLQSAVRFASHLCVPTLRDILSLLAWSITGHHSDIEGLTCETIQKRARNRGPEAFDSSFGYYNLIFGTGLRSEDVDRSPLMASLRAIGLGDNSDPEVDSWLRDPTGAPTKVQRVANQPLGEQTFLNLIPFKTGWTFADFGEILATSDDESDVETCIQSLADPDFSPLRTWRRRVFFEANSELDGVKGALRRLGERRFLGELLNLAQRVGRRESTAGELQKIIRGLNALTTGCGRSAEGLLVPDAGSLFSRDPRSYLGAYPAPIHGTVAIENIRLTLRDSDLAREWMDCDDLEVYLTVSFAGSDQSESEMLDLTPDIFEALRAADEFSAPTYGSPGEMNELRRFFGSLASRIEAEKQLRIADPETGSVVRVGLPASAGA